MKKRNIGILCVICGLILGICATVCVQYFILFPSRVHPNKNDEQVSLVETAKRICYAIKTEDYSMLSRFVHPDYGVVFTPYSTVDLASNQCFTASEIRSFDNDDTTYIWGLKSDTDTPIELTPTEYIKQFVYDYDYCNASILSLNQVIMSGNSLENVMAIFPNAQFVDIYNPGTDANDHTDWSVLRLVFELYKGEYMLTAIIHCEYTI